MVKSDSSVQPINPYFVSTVLSKSNIIIYTILPTTKCRWKQKPAELKGFYPLWIKESVHHKRSTDWPETILCEQLLARECCLVWWGYCHTSQKYLEITHTIITSDTIKLLPRSYLLSANFEVWSFTQQSHTEAQRGYQSTDLEQEVS